MPEIHADAIAQVILLAREVGEATAVGARDGVRHGGSGSLAARELRDFIANLNEEEQYSLVAVMWIGRDSFTADEYDEAYDTARLEATNPTEDYLVGIPMLADYLESGLEALGISPGDVEQGVI
ncbi:hypothetical protein DKT77_14545 [Meridianimarinicoccus roseus]|jgi:hypothetical protein|uniref:DUF3775 domain-containing protein n=1 Tax=Meridianimarinicoccus roseus TaxID=2072018 RepID=A0A2V2LF52_9RHOB|nr:DUF3775 domain-containing protein [Meridianimarinicoccus roseus]PWR01817.1 hypothetical protein DKT77_14545 [Meridianimarinicoccus roseus]